MSTEIPVETPAEEIEEIDAPDEIDEAAIERMHAVARLLDDGYELPVVGIRVGIDPILGLLPVGGDLVSGAIGLYIVAESARLGVTYKTIARQLVNIAADIGIGSVPVVGDAFDLFFRSNRRNVNLALDDLGVEMDLDE